MTAYTEALEYQVKLWRWATAPQNRTLFARAVPEQIDRKAIVDGLRQADPYYWSPQICDVIYTTYRDIPETRFSLDFLPGQHGFFWFTNPLPLPPYRGRDGKDLAHHVWGLMWTDVRRASDNTPGMGVTVFEQVEGVAAMLPRGVWTWWPGETQLEAAKLNHVVVDQEAALTGEQFTIKIILDILLCASLFLKQTILVAQSVQTERHARKRVAREGWHEQPLVQIVQLRKRQTHGTNTLDNESYEWSCQWVVRGHWRQQFYPSKHANQPIWIMPYVKGPDDKPLKPPRATVFAVVR